MSQAGAAAAGPPIELSVVIPAHNSGDRLARTVQDLKDRISGRPSEIVIVENGSTDPTMETCEAIRRAWDHPTVSLRVIQSKRGMGHALRAGIGASSGRAVLLTADDLPFGCDDLDAFEQLQRAKAEPVAMIGSKAHAESEVSRGVIRDALTWSFMVFRRIVLGMRTGDPQGTLLVRGTLLREVTPTLREGGYLFTTELVHVLELMGIQPVEVPVRLRRAHRDHRSRVSFSDALSMAVGLLRVRRRHRSTVRDPAAS